MSEPKQRRVWHRDRFVPSDACVKVECSECGRPYWLPPCKAEKYVTCGAECASKRRARLKEARKRTCAVCKKVFYPRHTQLRAGAGNCCSHKCLGVLFSGENNPMAGKALTPEQRMKWRQARDQNQSWLRGESNPRWSGGKEAKYKRDLETGRFKETSMRRRERMLGVLPKGTVQKLKELQRGRCAICGEKLKPGFHLDHIYPLSKGGAHTPDNVQLLCPGCNMRKNARDPIKHMQSLGRLL